MEKQEEVKVALTNEQASFILAKWLRAGPTQQKVLWQACERTPELRDAIHALAKLVSTDEPAP